MSFQYGVIIQSDSPLLVRKGNSRMLTSNIVTAQFPKEPKKRPGILNTPGLMILD